jgi:triosephosphate isomerase (TIM)
MIVINFKAYKEGSGKNAVRLAKICSKIALKFKRKIILSVQESDISFLSKIKGIEVISQHIDALDYGAHTGAVIAEDVKSAGAKGSLLNHSEKRIPFKDIVFCIKKLKKLKMKSFVCVQNISEAKKIAKLKPDFIAYEPPELIGGKISVSTAKPNIIKKVVNAVNIPILVGAGIHSREDIVIAKNLGAKGILVSSAFVKAKNPEKILKEFAF